MHRIDLRDQNLRRNFVIRTRIWEAYCDVEQAIEVSKFIYNLHERLGKVRPLRISKKNDPKTIPLGELITVYKFVNSNIASADEALRNERGEDAIEFARKAERRAQDSPYG